MNSKVKVYFLGTNGWFPTDTGHTTCHLIDAPEAYIILDAGTGIFRIDEYIVENKPIFLFLSHFHLDHIFGLHILNKFYFPQGVTIVTQNGSSKYLNSICNQPFTVALKNLPIEYKIIELNEGLYDQFPFGLKAKKLIHSSRCFGYRFEFNTHIVAYTTDTGVCNGMKEIAKDADLLIAECGLRPGEVSPSWPHLNPTDSAGVALNENVKKLALIHFDAEKYQKTEDREDALQNAKTVFPNTIVTYDNMVIEL